MDSAVLAAMVKWPKVPAVFGWLALTARGEWRIRGQPIGNAAIREFIGRNYAGDEAGRWYFQNGPQRVYVSLEAAPWSLRIHAAGATTHNGSRVQVCRGAAILDDGRLVLDTELGAGLIDDRDASVVVDAIVDSRGVTMEDAELAAMFEGRAAAFVAAARLGLEGD